VVWIAPIVLVVVGVLGFVLFGGGGAGGIIGPREDDTIPAFDFKVGKTSAVSVSAEKTDKSSVPAAAKTAATDVTAALDTLYTEGFLDPANWRDGSYDEVWPVFAEDAAGAAQQDGSTLTVGANGGDFEKIAEPKGRIAVKVLLNDRNGVATAVAIVRFSAVGTRTDGKLTVFRSSGQYFLRQADDGWQVYSFDVSRDDQLREPKPSPSGSASGASS
jgi:hypothetical protein